MTSKETANRGKPNGQSCGKDCIDYTINLKRLSKSNHFWFKRVE